jgi:CheY-like chemotaxis protein
VPLCFAIKALASAAMQHKPYARLAALVADNSPNMAELVAVMLRGLGVKKVTTAPDAATAFGLLRARKFDVLILADDIAGMGGVELTRRLRLSEGSLNQKLAIIMMSAEPNAAGIAAARDAGITEFLRKPFSAEHIAARLESLERNFVTGGTYAGPDRRRRTGTRAGTDRRGVA